MKGDRYLEQKKDVNFLAGGENDESRNISFDFLRSRAWGEGVDQDGIPNCEIQKHS